MLGHAGQRAAPDHGQRIGQRAFELGLHLHHRALGQAGNAGVGLGEPQPRSIGQAAPADGEGHAGAVEHQFAFRLAQGWPGRGARGHETGRHIGIVHLADFGCNVEGAVGRVIERHLPQVAFYLEAHVPDLSGQNGRLHIIAGIGTDHQRQVAVYPLTFAPAQAAVEFQDARKPRARWAAGRIAGAPAAAELALQIGIGQAHVAKPRLDVRAVQLPGQVGAQSVHGNDGLLKHPRKTHVSFGQADFGLSALLVQIELDGRSAEAWSAGRGRAVFGRGPRRLGQRVGGQRQPVGFAFGVEAAPAGFVACPVQLQVVDGALRAQLGQPVLHGGGQGQTGAEFAQGIQADLAGLQLTRYRLVARHRLVEQAQAALLPAQAAAGFEGQLLGTQLPAA